MIGVVVPAHNEEAVIAGCLSSLEVAARCPALHAERVLVVVVLDSCDDGTAAVARRFGASTVSVDARNVGTARAVGAQHALDAGVRWIAFTDADSIVAPDWFSTQLALRSDAVCGTITVHDWSGYGDAMRRHFRKSYTDADGHRHIHGANLGVSARAYRAAGGFRSLTSSEDVALVGALQASGATIAWSAAPRVVTSARRCFRAPGGFGATLECVERDASRRAAGVTE